MSYAVRARVVRNCSSRISVLSPDFSFFSLPLRSFFNRTCAALTFNRAAFFLPVQRKQMSRLIMAANFYAAYCSVGRVRESHFALCGTRRNKPRARAQELRSFITVDWTGDILGPRGEGAQLAVLHPPTRSFLRRVGAKRDFQRLTSSSLTHNSCLTTF